MSIKIRKHLVSKAIERAVTYGGINPKRYIVIHETANTSRGANASAHARLQANGNSRNASWHYQVDDKEIVQSFPDNAQCWHAGNRKYNSESIAIEICVNSDGNLRKAIENAVELVRHLMKRYGIPVGNVIQHNHASGKNCPTNIRAGRGMSWTQFKSEISKQGGGLSVKQYNELKALIKAQNKQIKALEARLKRKQDAYSSNQTPSPTHEQAVNWAKSVGLINGKDPHKPITREQLASILYRALANESEAEEYALEAIEWAKESGVSDGSKPASVATRQQVITMIKRAVDAVENEE